MRVSGFFNIRYWSAGLLCVIVAGQTIAVARGQSPQPPANPSQTAQPDVDRVQSWLLDANKAVQQGKWELAERYLQVAEAVAKQPGQTTSSMDAIVALRQQVEQRKAVDSGAQATVAGQFATASAKPIDATNPAMRAMLKARQALASGDVALATTHMNEAEKLGGDFASMGDSPESVGKLIKRQNELAGMARSGDAQQYNQMAASFLLEQADQLMAYKDLQAAEMLVNQAVKFPADFAVTGRDPNAMLAKITQSKSTTAAAMPLPTLSETSMLAQANKLLSQAQLAMDQGNWSEANNYVQMAKALNLPDSAFGANQYRPWQMELTIQKAMRQKGLDTTNTAQAAFAGETGNKIARADYIPENDTTKNTQASATDIPKATQAQEEINLGQIPDSDQAMFRQLQSSVFKTRAEAERLISSKPQAALSKMMELRAQVSNSQMLESNKSPLLTIVDRDIQEMQRYIQQNLSEIQNNESNVERLERVDMTRERRYEVEKQIQKLVEDFNKLNDQGRHAEAAMVAHQAAELDPESEIVALLTEKAKILDRQAELDRLRGDREETQWLAFERDRELGGTGIDSQRPYQHGDAEKWARSSEQRLERLGARQFNSETERRIWSSLKNTKIQGDFRGPLSEAMMQMASQGGCNIVFDQLALTAEGLDSSRPVDVPIREPISFESALTVVLNSVGLVFVVENEVIKVTSRDAQRKNGKTQTYYVGDLVTPITATHAPAQMNFITPSTQYNTQNTVLAQNQMPMMMNANADTQNMNMTTMAQALPNGPFGQGFGMQDRGYGGNGPQSGTPVYASVGAPQLGGVTQADFQPLINLIQTTIAPDEWSDTGTGDGTIQAFVPNLSLIVSQTQEVQDQIQDLLKRLRELNDVQIVVEVRFIVLSDRYFERIGVDFDFNINDNSGLTATLPDEVRQSAVVGGGGTGNAFTPTGDLDIAFRQNNFASAVPTFGGFDPNTAANFGFAILSDIEVFFMIQAAKGDQRTHISQAPTVTMFNGQSASVTDASQRPFVTSVIPIVGDFAVAHQPVISILPDGTTLNVQAVASDDRRFVRMSLVPFFSQVTDVKTFTFSGTRKVRRASDNLLQDLLNQAGGTPNPRNQELETETEGITIQLPVLSFTQVNTVVSVPDGGTVLMGGIKRMTEGRIERGVPMLSNLPYINRLFKNVGIGRDTSNMMMMVTPRIIIQEEEEQAQVGPVGGN